MREMWQFVDVGWDQNILAGRRGEYKSEMGAIKHRPGLTYRNRRYTQQLMHSLCFSNRNTDADGNLKGEGETVKDDNGDERA